MPARKRVERKTNGVTIKTKIKGVKDSPLPLKAVIYTEDKKGMNIISEEKVSTDEIQFDLDMDSDNMPENAKLAVVPEEVRSESHIRRIAEAEDAPVASIDKTKLLSREGVLEAEDLVIKPVESVVGFWRLRHKVCGQVFKRDPVSGEKCPVPGATVRVFDVDLNLFWWHPHPGPWGWLYPYMPYRREEIGKTVTDECGHFCLYIPYFDIDAVLGWRLRFRCMWEILKPPTILDAIELGVRPDIRYYPELEKLPELDVKPIPGPGPDPVITEMEFKRAIKLRASEMKLSGSMVSMSLKSKKISSAADVLAKPKFDEVKEELFERKALFDPVEKTEISIMDQPAFPHSIAAPQLPDDDSFMEMIGGDGKIAFETVREIRAVKPLARLLLCWPQIVPEWKLFQDVPDIIFKVEQDIDEDGSLETIYDEGFFDVNWNLDESTTNVQIEAWPNAICVPCGPGYKPCTTAGIVGINDMALDPAYLDPSGYAIRVNRPCPGGTVRPPAQTPLCSTLRIVGCPDYGHAAYYKVFYKYEGGPETHFTQRWHVYDIGAGISHHVVPDAAGFYPVLTPPDNYFPYHTLMNWRSQGYPDGKYEIRLALYDGAHNPIGAPLPSVKLVIDNSKPTPVDFLSLEYREGGGAWNTVPLHCPVIKRTPGVDLHLRVKYNVAASHLRDVHIHFRGCDGYVGSDNNWHQSVDDNNKTLTWTTTLPGTKHEGGYHFYLEGRSRAFNATGGLASNWYFDPLHVWRGKVLNVVVLDETAP